MESVKNINYQVIETISQKPIRKLHPKEWWETKIEKTKKLNVPSLLRIGKDEKSPKERLKDVLNYKKRKAARKSESLEVKKIGNFTFSQNSKKCFILQMKKARKLPAEWDFHSLINEKLNENSFFKHDNIPEELSLAHSGFKKFLNVNGEKFDSNKLGWERVSKVWEFPAKELDILMVMFSPVISRFYGIWGTAGVKGYLELVKNREKRVLVKILKETGDPFDSLAYEKIEEEVREKNWEIEEALISLYLTDKEFREYWNGLKTRYVMDVGKLESLFEQYFDSTESEKIEFVKEQILRNVEREFKEENNSK